MAKPEVFLDSSALFAAVWSDQGGGRELLRLGEAGIVHIVVSDQVLCETEAVLRRKAPQLLQDFAILVHRSRSRVHHEPSHEVGDKYVAYTSHSGDARIVAAAVGSRSDYLATLDRSHLLGNPTLERVAGIPIGTPGDCIAWLAKRLGE